MSPDPDRGGAAILRLWLWDNFLIKGGLPVKSLFVSLFTTSLLTGCQLSTDPSEALRVAVAVSPATVRGGDTALVTVRLINESLHATTVSGSSTCRLAFDVLD